MKIQAYPHTAGTTIPSSPPPFFRSFVRSFPSPQSYFNANFFKERAQAPKSVSEQSEWVPDAGAGLGDHEFTSFPDVIRTHEYARTVGFVRCNVNRCIWIWNFDQTKDTLWECGDLGDNSFRARREYRNARRASKSRLHVSQHD